MKSVLQAVNTGGLTIAGVYLSGVFNEKIWIHLVDVDACLFPDRRLAEDADNRDLGEGRVVERTSLFHGIINLIYAYT